MSIYTKTGDKGETGLVSLDSKNPVRISKSSLRIEVIGTIDELNSFLGIAKSLSIEKPPQKIISEIQSNLFEIGSILAGAKLRFLPTKTKKLEKTIDEWEGQLPVLKNFILPGGSLDASLIFYGRTIAIRVERRLVSLSKKEEVNLEILKYINRLSDFLFTLGRFVNYSQNTPDDIWSPLKSPKK
ncbi:cob(I)yrinic acid a,c-diamide adenosyltransferase [Candidatus Microgenomates bacterium]|nr:cob(I)yrinic acid a,c-diamide adenosyltransferase [Candidatus Microgenomates bacterium]